MQRVGSGAGTDTGWIMGAGGRNSHLRASVSSVSINRHLRWRGMRQRAEDSGSTNGCSKTERYEWTKGQWDSPGGGDDGRKLFLGWGGGSPSPVMLLR